MILLLAEQKLQCMSSHYYRHTSFWLYIQWLNPTATNSTDKCQVAHRNPKGKNTPKKATCNRLANLAPWSDFFPRFQKNVRLKPTNREGDNSASKSPKMARPGKRQCSLEIQKHKSIRSRSLQHSTKFVIIYQFNTQLSHMDRIHIGETWNVKHVNTCLKPIKLHFKDFTLSSLCQWSTLAWPSKTCLNLTSWKICCNKISDPKQQTQTSRSYIKKTTYRIGIFLYRNFTNFIKITENHYTPPAQILAHRFSSLLSLQL